MANSPEAPVAAAASSQAEKAKNRELVKRSGHFISRNKMITLAVLASLAASFYWGLWASDRYVSESHVIIERTNLAGGQNMDFSSLLSGTASGTRADQLLLRDFLRSKDMLIKMDGALRLREHYSSSKHDIFSRLGDKNEPIESFHQYFQKRVSIEFDDYTGVLVIRAQAYDAATARQIAEFLLKEGETFMNQAAQKLAGSQVEFLQQQVNRLYDQALFTRQELVAYQNKHGMISPQASAENISAVVARLEGQRIELEAQRRALMAYLVQDHASVVMLTQQIQALDRQIKQEKNKLASSRGASLNQTVEEYQRLEMEAGFAQDVYKTALVALEKGRFEATRMLKQLSVVQAPLDPQEAVEPRRIYNTVVYVLVIWLLTGVALLLRAIVQDHKD